MKKAFIFPGQGAQKPFMGKSFYDKYLPSKEVFQSAEDLLSMSIISKIFSSDEEALKRTDFCQIALFVTSVAILHAVEKELEITPFVTAGLSLGEYGALYAAKKVSFDHILPLIKERGLLMHQATMKEKQGMCAVFGLEEKQIPAHYQIANCNSPGQLVIGGTLEEMERAKVELKNLGAKRVLSLNVAGAFHTNYMEEAKQKLSYFARSCKIVSSDILFVMNMNGAVVSDPDEIRDNLVCGVSKQTRWLDCMLTMETMDVDYIEIGPSQLCPIAKKMNIQNSVICIEDVKDLEGLYETI